MRTLFIVTFLLFGIITITACRGSNQATRQLKRELKDAPRWYKKPPSDDKKFMYSVASAKSTRRDMAKEKAVTGATVTMARKLSLKVEALQKDLMKKWDQELKVVMMTLFPMLPGSLRIKN